MSAEEGDVLEVAVGFRPCALVALAYRKRIRALHHATVTSRRRETSAGWRASCRRCRAGEAGTLTPSNVTSWRHRVQAERVTGASGGPAAVENAGGEGFPATWAARRKVVSMKDVGLLPSMLQPSLVRWRVRISLGLAFLCHCQRSTPIGEELLRQRPRRLRPRERWPPRRRSAEGSAERETCSSSTITRARFPSSALLRPPGSRSQQANSSTACRAREPSFSVFSGWWFLAAKWTVA